MDKGDWEAQSPQKSGETSLKRTTAFMKSGNIVHNLVENPHEESIENSDSADDPTPMRSPASGATGQAKESALKEDPT